MVPSKGVPNINLFSVKMCIVQYSCHNFTITGSRDIRAAKDRKLEIDSNVSVVTPCISLRALRKFGRFATVLVV